MLVPNSRTAKRIEDKTMEREIGEIFEFEEVKLQVVKGFDCGIGNDSCYFLGDFNNCNPTECFAIKRKDRTSVKFIKIEN